MAKTYHFVVGDMAAKPLLAAFEQNEDVEIIVLRDILNVGPVQKQDEDLSFSGMRSAFWQEISGQEQSVDDTERVLQISGQMFEGQDVYAWFWMSPLPADICAYYWLLHYFSKHPERFSVINIAGLPFLNEQGKLFFPKSIADIGPKEIQKATRLARMLNPSEIEVDLYEWKQIKAANAAIRTAEGGKKLAHHNADLYDKTLLSYCGPQFQKTSKILNQAMSKSFMPVGDLYLSARLRHLSGEGILEMQQATVKSCRDVEYRLPGAAQNENV